MPSLLKRMRKTSALLDIRLGSGAYKFPKDVARINMRFAPKIGGGHWSARKFWRHELIRLKFHNPAVPMTIDRSAAQSDPAIMTVFFTSPSAPHTSGAATGSPAPTTNADGTASEHEPFGRTETISMSNSTPDAILEQLVRVTKAVEVPRDPKDDEELQALEEANRRSEKDRAVSVAKHQAKKAEERLLARARGQLFEKE